MPAPAVVGIVATTGDSLPRRGDSGQHPTTSVAYTVTSVVAGWLATFSGMSAEPAEHLSIRAFRAELASRGGAGPVVVLPESAHTAALAAQALGCEVGAIANSLLFDAAGRPVLILTSGAHRVDTAKAARTLGVERLRRASPDFVREHTGQVIGGVSPLGHPAPLPMWIDPWLQRHPEVWAAAGHPSAVFRTSYDELVRLTGAAPLEVD
jgi:prolyl-tRNA editing enzyme YbaK/EbsC (Cys-tRNA(Pro) deacylase)